MESISTQLPIGSRSEQLSALIDGEWLDEAGMSRFFTGWSPEEQATWECLHLIGDTLRSEELALEPAVSARFLRNFSARFASEPHVLTPALPLAARLRRRAVPVVAAAAALATLSWIVVPQLQRMMDGAPSDAQMVVTSVAPDALQRVAVARAPAHSVGQPAAINIIRDANLDQYLEAHRQFAQQSVVNDTMPVIQAAVVTAQGQ